MALRFRGEHHRNPSGLHAKVKWLISKSDWNLDTIRIYYEEIWKNIVHLAYDNEMESVNTLKAIKSWEKAIKVCYIIIYPDTWHCFETEELKEIKNKDWVIKLSDYYNTRVKNDALTKAYFT